MPAGDAAGRMVATTAGYAFQQAEEDAEQTAAGAEVEVPPPLVLADGRAQDGLQSLRDLAESVVTLRRQIVSASPRRGVQDSEQTCVNNDLAGLLGVGMRGWYVLLRAMRDGRLPSKLLGIDRAWANPILYVQRLHAVRFWVAGGITELEDLRRKLDAHSAAEPPALAAEPAALPANKRKARESANAEHDGVSGASGIGASNGADAPECGAQCELDLNDWRDESDELLQGLIRCMGYASYKQWEPVSQRHVIETILQGRDAVVARSTGGGKSLCFQMPPLIDALRVTARASIAASSNAASSSSDAPSSSAVYKTAVVITPQIALMQNQVHEVNTRLRRVMGDDLVSLGVPADGDVAAYLGMAQADPHVEVAAVRGAYRLLYITEKMLFTPLKPTVAHQLGPALKGRMWVDVLEQLHSDGRLLLVAIDEADVVVTWAENNFRTNYGRLGELRARLVGLPMLALSAVPTPTMWEAILASLRMQNAIFSAGSIYRSNLFLAVRIKEGAKKMKEDDTGGSGELAAELRPLISAVLREAKHSDSGPSPTIIYTWQIHDVERIHKKVVEMIESEGRSSVRVDYYHGGRPIVQQQDEGYGDYIKRKVEAEEQEQHRKLNLVVDFVEGRVHVVVANDAFGMGINHPRVRRILWYGSPKSIEQFYNHIGRAGRDGQDASCTLICHPKDFDEHESRIRFEAEMPGVDGPGSRKIDASSARRMLASANAMRSLAATDQCRWAFLTSHWEESRGGPGEGAGGIALGSSGCGHCDNCRFHAQTADDEGERSRNFGQVGVLVAFMVHAAALTSKRRGRATEQEFLATNKRGDSTFSTIAQLKKSVDKDWRTWVGTRHKSVWTQPRLYLFLNVLCEIPSPWVRRECWRVPANASAPPGTTHARVEFSLTSEGLAILQRYDADEAISLWIKVPLFLRQLEGGFDAQGPSDNDELEGDEVDDEYVEDCLAIGQKFIEKGGERCYMVSCVIDERTLSKGLEYKVSWQKHSDTQWVRAGRYASPSTAVLSPDPIPCT